MAWVLRNHVSEAARDVDQLESDEAEALSEQQIFVGDDGKISHKRRYLSISATVRLSARIASRIDANFQPDFSGTQWQNFRSFVDLRNRLTHPKSLSDLEVADHEIDLAISAFFWLLELSANAMDAANAALRAHNSELSNLFSQLQAGDLATWSEYRRLLERNS